MQEQAVAVDCVSKAREPHPFDMVSEDAMQLRGPLLDCLAKQPHSHSPASTHPQPCLPVSRPLKNNCSPRKISLLLVRPESLHEVEVMQQDCPNDF